MAFFGICKNANTSIKAAFLQSMGMTPGRVHDPALLHYAGAEEIAASGLWSFAICWHPVTRAFSCWKNKCGDGWNPRLARWGLCQGMTFNDFCLAIARVPDCEATDVAQHFRSQVYDLLHGAWLVPSYIGRFEDLLQAWVQVQEHFDSKNWSAG